MPIQHLHFAIDKATFVPEWEIVGPKRLGMAPWRKGPAHENPQEVIAAYLIKRVGRPTRPLICSLAVWSREQDNAHPTIGDQVKRFFYLHAHDGASREWSPAMIAQIDVVFVIPPHWQSCDRCGAFIHIQQVDPCECKIHALAETIAAQVMPGGAANDRGPL